MQRPPDLPPRFPCWVRAKFSYGGESKYDLGFMEGDLIECLNAGDGSWWMGRLWRDKRVKGLFPSNFVEILDMNFRPAVRSSSPLPHRSPSTNPFNPQPPQINKVKPSRKPYQSYSAPNPTVLKRAEMQKQDSAATSRNTSTTTRYDQKSTSVSQARHNESRAVSPVPPTHFEHRSNPNYALSAQNYYDNNLCVPHLPSPDPTLYSNYSYRATSSALPSAEYFPCSNLPTYREQNEGYSRPTSPVSPPLNETYTNHSPSPEPHYMAESSTPPPVPPPHRIVFASHMAEDSTDYPTTRQSPREPSSSSASSRAAGLTPSPLRSAMDDVISSLADMGLTREDYTPEPISNPWSPESFGRTYSKALMERSASALRATSSSRCSGEPLSHQNRGELLHYASESSLQTAQQPPLLSNYVQRMESRLGKVQHSASRATKDEQGPPVPPKWSSYDRPKSFIEEDSYEKPKLRHRRSAYEVGKSMLGRTFTNKTNYTNSSGTGSTTTNTTASTERSLMSGPSATGLSNTSAGSLERKRIAASNGRSHSSFGTRKDQLFNGKNGQAEFKDIRSETPVTSFSYHSSHASEPSKLQSQVALHEQPLIGIDTLGGLVAPKPKKNGFFKKIIETAKTGAANAKSSFVTSDSSKSASMPKVLDGSITHAGGYRKVKSEDAKISDANSGIDWVQVRRDVNRSNSLSKIERIERREKCQMMDFLAINPVDELNEQCDGNEGADGLPIAEPTNFHAVNFSLVDKNTRFINSLPPMTNSISLATGFVCRPYKSDVQRLRAIFTWVSEKIMWEGDFNSEFDSRRVIQSKKGCTQEVANLVAEMCAAVGICAEVVRGYLKIPGEVPELNYTPHPNHWWNTVLIDNEWRIMDCSLAAPSHPNRGLFSSSSSQISETWWFLTCPTKICWTHVPEHHQQQHICPPIPPEVLLALPCACPPFFKNEIEMVDYDTSLVRIEDLELVHIKFRVPADVECVAEVEAKAFERDADGDFFESGEIVKKRALSQAEWIHGQKRYTVKALLPADEGSGILKIYAGKRGLMHSIKDIPYPLAFALPIIHTGNNPPYEFLTRHPTPHAQRHDLYVAQPQCQRLAINNTFVFAIRQHPSSLDAAPTSPGGSSPIPIMRPCSAISMSSTSATTSNPSSTSSQPTTKPAKLAIQSPGGKVMRLMRKEERNLNNIQSVEKGDGGTWETIIKIGERGVWRGLVLADRTARWCVFAEWTCE
ncbi:BgTH12-07538 [Blumeria graminis f. sp. triticale]|uniref:Bgt-463 n=4 Tax=Blumeria graminis TaxID=34373 RepID=A0A9X9PS93_BLUGR|nr:BgTH12-07538 [Blumeria graminis f. sp. triticale]VCU40613.1 Bgt-463 [Blumeria graminis f. sp. tritici]